MLLSVPIKVDKVKVFLGGTCNGSTWRDALIPMLTKAVDYFNPVVEDWTPECQAEEVRQREISDVRLYVITPKMTGIFAIAELVEDSIHHPTTTLVCFLREDDGQTFNDAQWKSVQQVLKLVVGYGAPVRHSLSEVAYFLNERDV